MADKNPPQSNIVIIDNQKKFLDKVQNIESGLINIHGFVYDDISPNTLNEILLISPGIILINRKISDKLVTLIRNLKSKYAVCFFDKNYDNFISDFKLPTLSLFLNETNPQELQSTLEKAANWVCLRQNMNELGLMPVQEEKSFSTKIIEFLEKIPFLVMGFNNSGIVTFWNEAISKSTGYTFDEISHLHDPIEILYPEPEYVQNVMRDAVIKNLDIDGLEYELHCKNNEKRFIQWYNIGKLLPVDGIFSWFIGIDTTEIRSMELQLNQMNKNLEEKVYFRTAQLEDALQELRVEMAIRREAEKELLKTKEEILQALIKEKELNEIRSNFITMVSHEFRTPLTIITSSAHLLEKHFKDYNHDKFMLHLGKIFETSKSMVKLMENVFDINNSSKYLHNQKINTEETEIIPVINKLIQKTEDNFNIYGCIKLLAPSDEIIFNVAPELLEKSLDHILDNAIKFSKPEPKVYIEVFKSENELVISISDNGIGIPDNEKDKLFKPFSKCSNAKNYPGTGIGLSIVKTCVEVMSGAIITRSKTGEGTTIIIKISSQTRF